MYCLFVLMPGIPAQALAENDYLKELNSEADELSSFNNGAPSQDENPGIEFTSTDKAEFETKLKKRATQYLQYLPQA